MIYDYLFYSLIVFHNKKICDATEVIILKFKKIF